MSELLSIALQDNDIKVRRCAIDGLINLGNVSSDNLGNAIQDEDFIVRKTVIDNVDKLQDEQVLILLITALNDIDGSIRLSAAKQIGDRLGGTRDAKSALVAYGIDIDKKLSIFLYWH